MDGVLQHRIPLGIIIMIMIWSTRLYGKCCVKFGCDLDSGIQVKPAQFSEPIVWVGKIEN